MEGVVSPVPYDEVLKHPREVFGLLSPQGDFYLVDFFQHAKFIREFFKDDKKFQKELIRRKDPMLLAYERGWIRVSVLGYVNLVNVYGTSDGLANQRDNINRLKELTEFELISTPLKTDY